MAFCKCFALTFSHSRALRSIAVTLEAAHASSEVSFEEVRALSWLKDAKNAAPAASVGAPAPTLPPVEEVAVAAQPASPAAVVPPPPEPVVAAAHEPAVVEEVAAPDQAAASEVPQVAPSRALQLSYPY